MVSDVGLARFPHPRGGEPMVGMVGQEAMVVFPTRVGVNRGGLLQLRTPDRFPHPRGGEPPRKTKLSYQILFSPPAWG